MPTYKLCYFNARGFAEISRLIFAAAGQEYEDVRWSREDWPKYKPESPTGKSPWLEVDGVKIAQSSAIARYLAKQFGLAGKDDIEAAKVDMVADINVDVVMVIRPLFMEQDEERKAAIMKSVKEEKMPEFLAMYNSLLEQNGGDGYFVGDSLTWADLQTFQCLSILGHFGLDSLLDKHPKLKAFKDRIAANPRIAEWLEKRPKTDM